jgi:hypothetical protein
MSCARLSEFTHVTIPRAASVALDAVTPLDVTVIVTVPGAGVPPPLDGGGDGLVGGAGLSDPPPHAIAAPAMPITHTQAAVRTTR